MANVNAQQDKKWSKEYVLLHSKDVSQHKYLTTAVDAHAQLDKDRSQPELDVNQLQQLHAYQARLPLTVYAIAHKDKLKWLIALDVLQLQQYNACQVKQ